MRFALVALLVATTLSGCLSTDDPDPAPAPEPEAAPQYEDDRGVRVEQPGALPAQPPAPGERTPDQAPQWRLGEYWVVKVYDYATGSERTAHRVVAGTEHGNYLVGFPIESFNNDIMVLHMPGYGDILPDLSYDAHDVPFKPLSFPLEEGKMWSTQWERGASTMSFFVETVTPTTAEFIISATGTNSYSGRAVYDVAMGELSMLDLDGYARYEVIEHGFGYDGVVRVPHAHDLVFFHGRMVGPLHAKDNGLLAPEPATDTVDQIKIPDSYDQLSFALLFQDFGASTAQAAKSPGVYSVKATAPDGEVFEDSFTPLEDGSFKAVFAGKTEPSGTWQLEAVAGGAGYAMLEGIGYHSIDIDLPSGCVLASANANHHGTLCKA